MGPRPAPGRRCSFFYFSISGGLGIVNRATCCTTLAAVNVGHERRARPTSAPCVESTLRYTNFVVPAQAGTQCLSRQSHWVSACAGTTEVLFTLGLTCSADPPPD